MDDEGTKRLVSAIIKGVADDYRAARVDSGDSEQVAGEKAKKRLVLRKWFSTPWGRSLCDAVKLDHAGCVRALIERYGE